MSISQHVQESAPGVIGTSIAGSFTLAGFLSSAVPVLQAISLVIGIAVGVVTFIYYVKKVRSGT